MCCVYACMYVSGNEVLTMEGYGTIALVGCHKYTRHINICETQMVGEPYRCHYFPP